MSMFFFFLMIIIIKNGVGEKSARKEKLGNNKRWKMYNCLWKTVLAISSF